MGPAGSGHFVKMVHNGIEYGIMQAYAEGLDLLRHKKEFGLDLLQISKIWQFGSVIRSWLLDLTVDALSKNPALEGIGAYVTDSGEGRWTAIEGIELGVPLADDYRRARRAIPFAGSGALCQQAARHDAARIRRPRGEDRRERIRTRSDPMKMDERVFPTLDALSRAALDELLRILHDSIAQRGRFAIALSGGHTPAKLYSLWAEVEQ